MNTPPLRVAYLLLRPPSYSETFIGSEIDAVRAAGMMVEVFHAAAAGERRAKQLMRVLLTLIVRPVTVLRHLRTLGFSYGARGLLASVMAIGVHKRVKAFGPDVIHTHFVNLPTAVALLVAKDLGKPVTAIAHAADFLLEANRPALNRRLLLLNHLYVISLAAAKQLGHLGVEMDRLDFSVVRAAYDGEFTEPARPGGVKPARLVTIARLMEKKGIDTSIAAVARLVQERRDVRYDVFGDGPLLNELRDQIAAQGLGGHVTLHGATAHATAMASLSSADVAVLACRRASNGDTDGIPVFLIEAASRGVPVVTTSVSGIPELVGDDGGWLVDPDDASGLAKTIADVIDAPGEANGRVAILRERIRSEFSPQLQAQRLIETWRRVVDTGERGRR